MQTDRRKGGRRQQHKQVSGWAAGKTNSRIETAANKINKENTQHGQKNKIFHKGVGIFFSEICKQVRQEFTNGSVK